MCAKPWGRPFTDDLGWEGDHKPELQQHDRCFIGNCQVCKAENVIIYNLRKDDSVAKFFRLTEEANLVCSKCLMKATILSGKSQVTVDNRQETRNEPKIFVQDPLRKPKTMLNEPTIFVWDQYDIYLRKQLMISTDGTKKEIPNEDWKKLQTPNGQLGSAWNCHLWTGLYHEFPKALDLATYVRDQWGVDVEIIRNAGNVIIMVMALFDIRKFEKLSNEIKTYSKERMGNS